MMVYVLSVVMSEAGDWPLKEGKGDWTSHSEHRSYDAAFEKAVAIGAEDHLIEAYETLPNGGFRRVDHV